MNDILISIEKGKIKRFFSARRKIIFEHGVYHITQRAPGREVIFLEETDYLYMLRLMKETKQKFDLKIFCFALLPNHLHLLLQINKQNLSEAMKNLFERYAMYFNTKYERKGHVFCGTYRAALCCDDAYLLGASLYIHLNPLKANLCEEILDYPWTSIIPYIKSPKKATFLDYQITLEILDEDMQEARKKYRGLLGEMTKAKFESVIENPKFLDSFLNSLVKLLSNNFVSSNIDSEAISSWVDLDKKMEALRRVKKLKTPQDRQARKYLIEQLRARGYNLNEIAKRLSMSRQTVYRACKCDKISIT